jgi:hypothetical protein
MKLRYLHGNQAWAFMYGDSLVPMGDHGTIFNDRGDAVRAANIQGLEVSATGEVAAA